MNVQVIDVVVVGGGPAGLTAALVLGRARRRVVVIDAGAPRNAPAQHMHGFLSRDGMPPADLLAAGRAEVQGYGVELLSEHVEAARRAEHHFTIRTAAGTTLHARRILLATGVRDALPAIPGARERWGRDLLHCPYCHGWEVRDQPIAVLGTRADAVQHAVLIRQWSDDLVFFAHDLQLAAEDRDTLEVLGIRVVDGVVTRLRVEADRLTGVELADGRVVPRVALFIRPVAAPHSDGLTSALGCELDDAGSPIVDGTGRTSVPGVWAAGNLVDPRLQVIAAAGAGSTAAIAINADLVQEDVAIAVVDHSRLVR